MFIGFLLTLKGREKIQKIYKITILISIFGILYTVSRTAIISLFVILAIFLFRRSIITTFKVIIIAISIIFLSPKAITPIIERFQYSEKELDYTNSSSRIGKWILYINHIRNEPGILLSGNTSNLYLNKWAARNKLLTASHNLYIEMVYRGGIIYLILTIILYFKLAKYIFKKENRFNGYYYLIPFILITFYTPDWGSFYYLGLFLSLGDKNTINVEKEQYKLIYQ
jgi:O-antigen ligase